jgi:hypothetical protein
MPAELPIACSLGPDELAGRAQEWRELAQRALIEADRTEAAAVQRYRRKPGVEAKLRELVALEAECCPFLDFALTQDGDEIVLTVGGPAEAARVIDLFSPPATR